MLWMWIEGILSLSLLRSTQHTHSHRHKHIGKHIEEDTFKTETEELKREKNAEEAELMRVCKRFEWNTQNDNSNNNNNHGDDASTCRQRKKSGRTILFEWMRWTKFCRGESNKSRPMYDLWTGVQGIEIYRVWVWYVRCRMPSAESRQTLTLNEREKCENEILCYTCRVHGIYGDPEKTTTTLKTKNRFFHQKNDERIECATLLLCVCECVYVCCCCMHGSMYGCVFVWLNK